MKQRIMALLLVCSLLISCLAGCSSSNSDTTTAASNTTTAANSDTAAADTTEVEQTTEEESSEPITITVGVDHLGTGWPENEEDDFLRTAIFEATNVWVDCILIDDYYTSLNVQLTGGTAPDFFLAAYENMKEYAAQDLIQPITQYKDDIAPVFEYVGEEFDNYTLYVDDEMYCFPKGEASGGLYTGFFLRQDILDEYGMEASSTLDELYDFLKKSMDDNITGQGTIGLSGSNMNPYNLIANAYGTSFNNFIIIKDGKVTNTLLDENMEAALTEAKRFYDAGLISSNTFNGSSGTLELREGKAVAGVVSWPGLIKNAYMNVLLGVDPDAEWTFGQPLTSEAAGVDTYVAYTDYNSNNGAKMCVNADTSEEKIKAYIKVINYLSTEEGMMLSWLGIQGTHWDYDADGNAAVLEGQAEAINYISTYQLVGRNDLAYLAVKFPEANEVMEYNYSVARLVKYNDALDVPDTIYLSDLNDYVSAQMLAFIKGDRAIDEYDTFIQELYDYYYFQAYLDIATEQLGELGLLN